MTRQAQRITGVILCGGEGRRMGGADKPLLTLHERPLVAHVLDRLEIQVHTVILSANRDLDAYRAFGHPVITDLTPGLGPLGGLASAAEHVRTPWIFCCPGDAPLLDRTLVATLTAAMDNAVDAVYPHDGERAQYLFLLLRTDACRSLPGYLAGGGRSVHGWLSGLSTRFVPIAQAAATFSNVNDPGELATLRAMRHARAER